MLSENAHVTPSLMLLGNTHCEVEVKEKDSFAGGAFYKPFCSFCFAAGMRHFLHFFSGFFSGALERC